MEQHSQHMKHLTDRLAAVGAPISREDQVVTLSGSLLRNFASLVTALEATTSSKTVEALPQKKQPFMLQITASHRSVRYNIDLPPIQSCSSKFWAWSRTATNFDKGWRGDHKHKIMDRPFMPKYHTLSEVLLQLVVTWMISPSILFNKLSDVKMKQTEMSHSLSEAESVLSGVTKRNKPCGPPTCFECAVVGQICRYCASKKSKGQKARLAEGQDVRMISLTSMGCLCNL